MKLQHLAATLVSIGASLLLCDFLAGSAAPPFRGEIRIAQGHEESLAITPSAKPRSYRSMDSAAIRQGIAAPEIPFDDPVMGGRWTNPDQVYDTLRLPFRLGLVQSKVLEPGKTQNLLSVRVPGAVSPQEIPIRAGDMAPLPGEPARVEAIRPWAGLVRHPTGSPSANVAVLTPAKQWLDNLMLDDGSWLRAGDDLAVHFVWHSSEKDARSAIAAEATAPKTESARWGVVDGGGVNWLESLIPGTGLTLRDGTIVTLAQVDLNHMTGDGKTPAILLQFEKAGVRRLQWVTANGSRSENQCQFDYPAARDMVFILHAWQDGSCIVTATLHHQTVSSTTLKEGESWTPAGGSYTLRLDQLLSTGIAVDAKQSPLNEVVLSTPKRTLRIREGETMTIGDDQIGFNQVVNPPRMQYELSLTKDHTEAPQNILLEPGQTLRIDGLKLSQGPVDPKSPGVAAIEVEVARSHILAVSSIGPWLMGLVLYIQTRRSTDRRTGTS